MNIFRRYKLVMKNINSTVVNKLQPYVRISALGPEGHCTSRFRRAMCISCRLQLDIHKGEGIWLMWTHVDGGRESKIRFFCGRHKWMAPMSLRRDLEPHGGEQQKASSKSHMHKTKPWIYLPSACEKMSHGFMIGSFINAI